MRLQSGKPKASWVGGLEPSALFLNFSLLPFKHVGAVFLTSKRAKTKCEKQYEQ